MPNKTTSTPTPTHLPTLLARLAALCLLAAALCPLATNAATTQPRTTLSLNGDDWLLTYNKILGQPDASQSQPQAQPQTQWGRWIPARVPGDVHLDLQRAGLILDPLISDNNKSIKWTEDVEWTYKKTFTMPPENLPSNPANNTPTHRIELVCDGLDTTADIYLNNTQIGHTNNALVHHRFDITPHIRPGQNEITIRIDPGFKAVEGKDVDRFKRTWNAYDLRRPWIRKAQQAYYWDVAPRMVTCGIWRDIHIETYTNATIRDSYTTSQINNKTATLTTALEIETFAPGDYTLQMEVHDNDNTTNLTTQTTAPLRKGPNTQTLTTTIPNPKLWWPNGMGDQHLYTITLKILDSNNHLLDTKTYRHGIRTIELLQEKLNDKESTFTFVVNGVKIFAKGGDWVPSDCIYGRINKTTETKLLTLARDANFNMLRVWGGGVYPDTWFYDTCDELGILVWQDFMYACGYYPDDEPAFMANVADETDKAIRKFRNHPSLALWCGNNEVQQMHRNLNKKNYKDLRLYGAKIFDDLLPAAVARLDPQTPYHPSSPYPALPEGQHLRGDQHEWAYTLSWLDVRKGNKTGDSGRTLRLWNYADDNYKFLSEFGFYGPSNLSSVRRFMAQHPVDLTSDIYLHHVNYFAVGFIEEMLKRFYKKRDTYTIEEYTIAGQMLQGEILKYILEELRSRMHTCSGALFWEYNDTWPHVGYAPVDYYLNVKPVYYYMRDAFAPLHARISKKDFELTVMNDTTKDAQIDLEYGCMTFDGKILFTKKQTVTVPAAGKISVEKLTPQTAAVENPAEAFVYVKLYKDGALLERNREFLLPIPKLKMPADTMRYEVERTGKGEWDLVFTADKFVWSVNIDTRAPHEGPDKFECSERAFDLWPGETKRVRIKTDADAPPELVIKNVNQFINE